MATLFLIHGFIGSGKTTFSKKLEVEKNAVRFTPDEWMIHFYGVNPPEEMFSIYHDNINKMIEEMAIEFLKRAQNVILDYGFWKREDRDYFRNLALNLNFDCVFYSMNSDFEVCKERALKRTNDMPKGALFIDEHALNKFWDMFQPMGNDEGFINVE